MGVFWAQIGQRITSADVMGCVTLKGVPTSGLAAAGSGAQIVRRRPSFLDKKRRAWQGASSFWW
ncbi:MAG: hypothetical protein ACJA0F_000077 [Dinoroseobacter sp.]|jgi:hypothetical protein